MLLPDDRIRIGGKRPAKMVNKVRGSDRLCAVTPAHRIAVWPVGPARERWYSQYEEAPGAQRSAECGECGDVKPGMRVKHSMQVFASQQSADGFRRVFIQPQPVSR